MLDPLGAPAQYSVQRVKVGILAQDLVRPSLPSICQWLLGFTVVSTGSMTVAGTAQNFHPVPLIRDSNLYKAN